MGVAPRIPGGVERFRKSLIPVMSSNSQNGYTIAANTYYNESRFPLWHAFDGNTILGGFSDTTNGSTLYMGASNKDPIIDITFPKRVSVSGVLILASTSDASGVGSPRDYLLSYYDDSTGAYKTQKFGVITGTSGTDYDVSDTLSVRSNKWRLTMYRKLEFVGVNQIILF